MKTHQLEDAMRALKLFGMLETLEARLAQATAGELGHVELLGVLCADEAARRDTAGLERRVKAARFEQTVTIEDYDFSFNPKIPAAQIRDLATLRFLDAGESVILHGPVGVGKSMIAQALGHAACRRGHSVVFTKTSRLLADLAGGHADRSWETRLRRWARPGLLILDLSRHGDYPDVDGRPPLTTLWRAAPAAEGRWTSRDNHRLSRKASSLSGGR
jgi:DNA replication protein DnaC